MLTQQDVETLYLMFYHREHHLFPRVPVHRLPELATRLDRDAPGYGETRRPVVPLLDPGFRRARPALFARKRPDAGGKDGHVEPPGVCQPR